MESIAGVILAGGRASRMGGRDKAFLQLAGRPLLTHCIDRFAPQVERIAVSSNSGKEAFSGLGLPTLPDLDDRRAGPLAGVLAGMRWAESLPNSPVAVVSVAVDTPFYPEDLVKRLFARSQSGRTIVMARSNGMAHPTFALWPLLLTQALQRFIEEGATLKVTRFAEGHGCEFVDFPVEGATDPFFNINTPADLAQAESLFRKSP